jgi:hypothetical protein
MAFKIALLLNPKELKPDNLIHTRKMEVSQNSLRKAMAQKELFSNNDCND